MVGTASSFGRLNGRFARVLGLAAVAACSAGLLYALPRTKAGNPSSVTLSLVSPQADTTVEPGESVTWFAKAFCEDEANLGLAMVSIDVEQDAANPERIDLEPGQAFSLAMRDFDWPGGFANPGIVPKTSGYGGTPVGKRGERNLAQIGGAQNTFGVAGPCLGNDNDICMGQDLDLELGVGQGPRGIDIAVGQIRMPRTPGTYTFRITSGRANVLTSISPAPAHSTVERATIVLSDASFSVTVQ